MIFCACCHVSQRCWTLSSHQDSTAKLREGMTHDWPYAWIRQAGSGSRRRHCLTRRRSRRLNITWKTRTSMASRNRIRKRCYALLTPLAQDWAESRLHPPDPQGSCFIGKEVISRRRLNCVKNKRAGIALMVRSTRLRPVTSQFSMK